MPEVSDAGGCISAMLPTVSDGPTPNNSSFLDKALRARPSQFG
jgi:hypothetical protein